MNENINKIEFINKNVAVGWTDATILVFLLVYMAENLEHRVEMHLIENEEK